MGKTCASLINYFYIIKYAIFVCIYINKIFYFLFIKVFIIQIFYNEVFFIALDIFLNFISYFLKCAAGIHVLSGIRLLRHKDAGYFERGMEL